MYCDLGIHTDLTIGKSAIQFKHLKKLEFNNPIAICDNGNISQLVKLLGLNKKNIPAVELFVIASYSASAAAYSTNGTSWTSVTLPTSAAWNCSAFGDDTFVLVASGATNALTSFTGETGSWTSPACGGDPNYTFGAVLNCCTTTATFKPYIKTVAGALTLMKNNLLELASRSIQKGGFGKYTSINPNQKYIEFRSAGGHDEMGQSYFENIDKIQNTMMRYAQAMAVAGNPAAERKEYYKKLYKLIAPSTGDVGLDLFARFTSGTITKEELKKQWAESILQKDVREQFHVEEGD